MRCIFHAAAMPSRERFRHLTVTAVFVLLLALVLAPWRAAVASDATDPTSVVSFAITSDPGPDQYYKGGEPIEVTVTFSGSVTVTGTPGLKLQVENGTTLAIYQRGSGTTALVFVWNWNLWQLGEDHEGVSIPAGNILLREGSIQDDSGNAVDLAHTGLPTQSGHRVDNVNPALIAALTRATENTVTMFWDEVLDGNHVPPASGFDVRKLVRIAPFSEQEPISVTHVAVSGNSVTLTFATEVTAGLFVTARYGYLPFDRPLSIRELVAGSPYLRDRAGNPAYNVRASARVSGTPPTSGPNLTSVTVVSDPAPPPRGSSYSIDRGEYSSLIENHADTESDTGYKNGEVIHVDVAFSGPAVIDARGAKPSIGIVVGSVTRQAEYLGVDGEYSLSETDVQPHCSGFREHMFTSSACSGADVLRGTTIRFQYVVAVGDEDTDGLSIPANGILLNGGKITDVWGNSAVLTHSALATQSGHKIDGILPQLAATGGVVVDGSMLTLSWSEDVVVDPSGLRTALSLRFFSITGNDDVTRSVTDVLSVDERAVTLKVEPAVSHGETGLTVSYWPTNLEDDIRVHPMFRAAFQSFGIRDGAGNFALEFSDRAVENRTAALVTAHFENVPESHDGSTAFTFELHFSEEPDGITATLVRENLFDVTGATITSAQQLTEDSNQAWIVTATPSGTDDIAISGQAAAAGTSATVPFVAVPEAPPALTATLESVPESHDGSTAFTFELHFSENIPGLSYKTVGGPLLDVTGANVNGARRLTAGSNQDWLVTVAPSGSDDISITLPARACGETAAICIADNRPLSEGISATVQMEPQAAQPSGGALTARFANVPESHDGLTAFTVELHFSENIPGLSYKTVGGGLLDATGANVTGARRLTAGSNQGWLVTVAPSVDADVTLTVPGTDDCAAPNAICVGDDRKLEAGASATITVTPIAVTVADTEIEEAEGATLDFVVTMNRASARDIQIWYRAYDGTATAGADYVAVSSSFTMAAGETTKTVSVSVLDDAHDEGAETVKFWLTGVRGLRASQITDPYAVGTITNSDPMPKAWITRFGRTVGSQVVDAVTARLEGGTSAHVTVGGMSLDGTSLAGADPSRWPEWASESEQRGGTRTMTERELLLGSSFHLSSGGDASGGPAFAAWGRVATGGFEADVDDVRMDGDVTTGLIGLDAEWDRVLAGLLLSQSKGDGSYTLSEEMGDDRGTVENTMTGVYPYARLEMSERVSAWGLAGLGSGEFTLNQEGQTPIKTDLGMRMGAVGVKGTVLDGSGPSGVGLSVKSDAMWVRTESDRTVGLESAEGDVSRLRLIVQGERVFVADNGATFTPSAEVGLRHDGGDAETGSGVEVGGGLRYTAGPLTIEGQVRMLVAHEESGYEEWGASGAIRMTPSASGRGLTLSIAPAWGRTGSATERLWSAHDARGLGADNEFEAAGQLAMDAGYGVGLPGNRGVLTPYAGMTLGDAGARTMRTGTRWQLGPDVVVGLEATRQASDGGEAANQVMLRAALRF